MPFPRFTPIWLEVIFETMLARASMLSLSLTAFAGLIKSASLMQGIVAGDYITLSGELWSDRLHAHFPMPDGSRIWGTEVYWKSSKRLYINTSRYRDGGMFDKSLLR